jgi:hypothetical protein
MKKYASSISILQTVSPKKVPQQSFVIAAGLAVPPTGIEPVRYRYRGILSPLRLPVPPRRHIVYILPQAQQNVNLH